MQSLTWKSRCVGPGRLGRPLVVVRLHGRCAADVTVLRQQQQQQAEEHGDPAAALTEAEEDTGSVLLPQAEAGGPVGRGQTASQCETQEGRNRRAATRERMKTLSHWLLLFFAHTFSRFSVIRLFFKKKKKKETIYHISMLLTGFLCFICCFIHFF